MIGIAAFFLTGGIALIAFTPYDLIAILPILLSIYLLALRNTLLIDFENSRYQIQQNLLGLKFGIWRNFKNYNGVTIKNTLLSDKNNMSSKMGISYVSMFIPNGRYDNNQHIKSETWVVKLVDQKREQYQLISLDKSVALNIINDILEASNGKLTAYLATPSPNRKLHLERLKKGKLVLLKS